MTANVLKLRDYFEVMHLQAHELPAICSVAYPKDEFFRQVKGFPQAARPETGRIAYGRGLTIEESQITSLGEACELASCCLWHSEDIFSATMDELGGRYYRLGHLFGFSDEQYANREDWNTVYGQIDRWPEPVGMKEKIDWIYAMEEHGKDRIAVPADFVLLGKNSQCTGHKLIVTADSNGCASGQTDTDAKLAALLELVERDATGLWWYGQRQCGRLPFQLIEDWPDLWDAVESRRRLTTLVDITSDIGIPTVAAISSDPDGGTVAIGVSSNFDWTIAAKSSVLELAQVETGLLMAIENASVSLAQKTWLRSVSTETLPWLTGLTDSDLVKCVSDDKSDVPLEVALRCCTKVGCRISFINLTREEIGVPTWRAISPDLCHFKPRFGRTRMPRKTWFAPVQKKIGLSFIPMFL